MGAVDDEKGITWALLYDVNHVNGQVIPQVLGNLDFGFPLPLKHSSIWLRSAAGVANGDRDSVVANFYFGGFGNNYIDDKTIKRFREYDSLTRILNRSGKRAELRSRVGGMELASLHLRGSGDARLLPDIAAAVAVRNGVMVGSRQ